MLQNGASGLLKFVQENSQRDPREAREVREVREVREAGLLAAPHMTQMYPPPHMTQVREVREAGLLAASGLPTTTRSSVCLELN